METRTLKVLRAEREESQREVADAIGISPAAYSKWEANPAGLPLEKLCKLADHFGVELGEIFLPGYENLIPIKGTDDAP